MKLTYSILFLFLSYSLIAQEYKSFKVYKKITGNKIVANGVWLKKDRKKQTRVWSDANLFNLNTENGFTKYTSISQFRDYYAWFDKERKKRGHEIKWIGISVIAANQLSYLDNWFIRVFIVRNKNVVNFAQNGSRTVFKYAISSMKNVLFSLDTLKGENAERWDKKYGMTEQCELLDSIYGKLSKRDVVKLERMAKGKALFQLAVNKKIRYEGDIVNCETRYQHGLLKLMKYYSLKN